MLWIATAVPRNGLPAFFGTGYALESQQSEEPSSQKRCIQAFTPKDIEFMCYQSTKVSLFRLLGLSVSLVCTMAAARCVEGDDRLKRELGHGNASHILRTVLHLKNTEAIGGESDIKKPLQEILKAQRVPIILDERSLEEESISKDEMVTQPLVGQSLYSYLEEILDNFHLVWAPVEGGIRITTKRCSANIVCVYNVSDLLRSDCFEEQKGQSDSVAAMRLRNVITSTIQPDYWDTNGGCSTFQAIRIEDDTLAVVLAPADAQVEMVELFIELRRTLNGREDRVRSRDDYTRDTLEYCRPFGSPHGIRSIDKQGAREQQARDEIPIHRRSVSNRILVRSSRLKHIPPTP